MENIFGSENEPISPTGDVIDRLREAALMQQYVPKMETYKQRLQIQLVSLKDKTSRIERALEILEKNPELEELLTLVRHI